MPPRRSRQPPHSRMKGLFADGVWQCDCEPRLPADGFRVKKDGKNHGRWFYTCQKPEPDRCGFFLWDEDAKPREANAVLNNSRNEPRSTPNVRESSHDFRALDENPKLMSIPERQRSLSPREERRASLATTTMPLSPSLRQPSFIDNSLDDETLASVDTPRNAIEHVAQPTFTAPSTPAKRKYHEITTDPNTGLITPSTGSDVSRLRTATWTGGVSTNTTPTPARFRDAIDNTGRNTFYESIKDYVYSEHRGAVQELCAQEYRKYQGVMKGREIIRLSSKVKDAKISELEHKVSTLEAEVDLQKALVRCLRNGQTIEDDGSGDRRT